MRQVVMYGPGDVRVEDRADPKIIEPADAVFDLTLPLDRAAEVHEAMDQRTAIKVLLTV